MTKKEQENNNGSTTIKVSVNFVNWLKSWKVHKNQSNEEQCEIIMDICKQKGVLEGK
jgi:hypothetical protein